ncbi:MAG: VOC family protein [Chloroflexi bacterium]|nr:VOC family protein [Chloroflexota bacterium]
MSYSKASYLQHVAIRVRDMQWHIRFFEEALGMPIASRQGPEDDPAQVWLVGGIQLIADPNVEQSDGQLAHLGIMAGDVEKAIEEVSRWEVTQMPQGNNWFALPDGLVIELVEAPLKG